MYAEIVLQINVWQQTFLQFQLAFSLVLGCKLGLYKEIQTYISFTK